MKPKTLILMGVAITCGLGASYMTSRLLAERQVSEPDKVVVLVAKKNLSMGDSVKVPDEMFEGKEFLAGSVSADAIRDTEQLKGRVLKHTLRAGDVVRNDDLYGDKDTPGLWANLPPGFRAVGIRVNMEEIAGGFASLPLSRVDIINTVRRGDDKSSYSQVLLENVLVVAADTQMHRDEQGRAMPANVVTVALRPEDVLKVRLAAQLGPLSLCLRKIGDSTRTDTEVLTAEGLKQGSKNAEVVDTGSADDKAPPKVAAEPKAAPEEKAPQVAKVEPQGKVHRLVIREGEHTKQTDYLLNDNNEVIVPEVTQSEVAPPRPGQPQAGAPRGGAGNPDDDLDY